MSGKPIKIPVDVETGASEGNLERVADGFDEIAKSTDKAADATQDLDRALDSVSDAGFEQVADDAKDAAKRIDRDLTRALEDAGDAAKQTSRRIGDDLGDGARRASEGMDEIKDSARQNAIETAASFDGSADSIVDGFQGAAAEAFAGFGPAAAAAGIAGTLGLGLLRSKMEEAKEEAQETREEIGEIASDLIALGGTSLGVDEVNDRLNEMATESDEAKTSLADLSDQAARAGIDYATYARGIAGDNESLRSSYDEVNARIGEVRDEQARIIERYGETSRKSLELQEALGVEWKALGETKAALEAKDATLNKSAEAFDLYSSAAIEAAQADEQATQAVEDHQRAVESYQSALEQSADPVKVYSELLAEKEAADREAAEATAKATKSSTDSWEDYSKSVKVSVRDLIDEWNDQAQRAEWFEKNLATIAEAGGQALADELRAKGPEVASAVASTIAHADPKEQKEAIEAHAGALGEAVTKEMSEAIDSPAGQLMIQTAVNAALAALGVPTIPVGADASYLTNSIRETLRTQSFDVKLVGRVGTARPV